MNRSFMIVYQKKKMIKLLNQSKLRIDYAFRVLNDKNLAKYQKSKFSINTSILKNF